LYLSVLFSSAVKRLTLEIVIFQVGFCVNIYNEMKIKLAKKAQLRSRKSILSFFFFVFREVFNKLAALTSKSELDS